MKHQRIRAFCRQCRHDQIFVRAETQHAWHLAASLLTFGLWLVSWAALSIGTVFRPWRCKHCGWHKPEVAESTVSRRRFAGIEGQYQGYGVSELGLESLYAREARSRQNSIRLEPPHEASQAAA